MDIHDLENTLENNEQPIDNLCENNVEMNPYVNTSESIHESNNIYPKNIQNKKINLKNIYYINHRRNDIMRSALKERYSNKNNKLNNAMNLAKYTAKGKSRYLPDYRLRILRSQSANKPQRENKHLKKPTTYETEDIKTDNIKTDDEWKKEFDECNKKFYKLLYGYKDVNLTEILTGVLQEVATGKITNFENIIGNLRIEFEKQNILPNANKKEVIFINFEDDTTRPVLKIEEKYLDIIKKWYEDCNLYIDIEDTNLFMPEVITSQDVSGVLFQDINYKYKDEYLNNYLPLLINNIICERSLKCYEKKYFKNISDSNIIYDNNVLYRIKNSNEKSLIKINRNILEELGVVVPTILIENNMSSLENEKNSLEVTEIYPYNMVFNKSEALKFKSCCDIGVNSDTNLLYNNSEYDSLNTKFASNCDILDNIIVEQNKNNFSSFVVLINDKFLQTIFIENPSKNVLYIIKNHSEYGFVKLFDFSTSNIEIIKFVEREFSNIQFNDIDEVNKKLLVTSQYIEFSNKHYSLNNIMSNEEIDVKNFLKVRFTFNNEIENKMKASTLYDLIISSGNVIIDKDKIAGFKTRLSKYLKDIGLQKKRYNDGFYYYGIVPKEISRKNNNSNELFINEFKKKRDEELETYTYKSSNALLGQSIEDIKEWQHTALGFRVGVENSNKEWHHKNCGMFL